LDVFLLGHTGIAKIWQKADAYEEAGKFCAFSNKKIETLNLKDIEARSWFIWRTAKVELDFRCIN
jgi:hypothetical protein